MAFQTRDVIDAMQAARAYRLTELRVDGGAAVMDLLLRLQADLLGRAGGAGRGRETTALGAAWLAGLAEGVWGSLDDIAGRWWRRRRRRAGRRPVASGRRLPGLAAGGGTVDPLGPHRSRAQRLSPARRGPGPLVPGSQHSPAITARRGGTTHLMAYRI